MVTEHFEFAGRADDLRLANDLGSNFETFTNQEFLESESLGPYGEISPGQTVKHSEIWAVFSGVQLPPLHDEDAFATAIDPYLKQPL